MNININGQEYEVIVERKNNRHTYLRIKDDLKIYITTNRLMTKKELNRFIEENMNFIEKNIKRKLKKILENDELYYLGKKYQIKNTDELANLDKWYRARAKEIFPERLEIMSDIIEEKIPEVNLYIRKMKTRWGVCNRKLDKVTLNLELIKKDVKLIDYVIIHELCHFTHPNHSKKFWDLVGKYLPNYKELRKKLKE